MEGVSYGNSGKMALYAMPAGWIGIAKNVGYLQACVCGSCGYTEFYAEKPAAVWEAWQNRR
jgi:hypothetical protein